MNDGVNECSFGVKRNVVEASDKSEGGWSSGGRRANGGGQETAATRIEQAVWRHVQSLQHVADDPTHGGTSMQNW